jgi:hypothetical protein
MNGTSRKKALYPHNCKGRRWLVSPKALQFTYKGAEDEPIRAAERPIRQILAHSFGGIDKNAPKLPDE